jgi:hypothetical protein
MSLSKLFDRATFAQLLAANVPVQKIGEILGISRAQAFRTAKHPEVLRMVQVFRSAEPELKLTVEIVDGWLIDLFKRATASDKPSDRTLCGQLIRVGYDRLGVAKKVETDTNINVTIASLSEQLAEADKRMLGYRERTAKLLAGETPVAMTGDQGEDTSGLSPLLEGESCAVHGGDAAQQNDSPPPKKSRVFNSPRQAYGREDLGEWRPAADAGSAAGVKDPRNEPPVPSRAELEQQSRQDWVSKLL